MTDPRYKGLIGVANPNTSGTALTTLATQIFLRGEEEGLEYMKKLHKNIANYTKSGVALGILAGRGEIGGLNLVKGAPHPDMAKKFIDWVVSAEAQETQPKVGAYQIPTNTTARVPEKAIDINSIKTVDYDFTWVAENGVRIQDRWTREVFTLPR